MLLRVLSVKRIESVTESEALSRIHAEEPLMKANEALIPEEQKQIATAYIKQLTDATVFRRTIVTTVVPLEAFYPAESYHQNFLVRNPTYPYIVYNDVPKVKHLEQEFPTMVKAGGDRAAR